MSSAATRIWAPGAASSASGGRSSISLISRAVSSRRPASRRSGPAGTSGSAAGAGSALSAAVGRSCSSCSEPAARGADLRRTAALQGLDDQVQVVAAFLQRLDRGYCRVDAAVGDLFQQRLHGMAEFTQFLEPRHPCAALEGVDFTLQVLHQPAVRQLVAPGIEQIVAAAQDLDGLLQENRQDAPVVGRGCGRRFHGRLNRIRLPPSFGRAGDGL